MCKSKISRSSLMLPYFVEPKSVDPPKFSVSFNNKFCTHTETLKKLISSMFPRRFKLCPTATTAHRCRSSRRRPQQPVRRSSGPPALSPGPTTADAHAPLQPLRHSHADGIQPVRGRLSHPPTTQHTPISATTGLLSRISAAGISSRATTGWISRISGAATAISTPAAGWISAPAATYQLICARLASFILTAKPFSLFAAKQIYSYFI